MNCLIECCSVPWSVFRAPSPLWACLWGRRGGQGHRSGRELSLCRPAWPRSAYGTQRYQTWLSCYRRGPAPAAGPKPPTKQAQARDQQVRISHTLYKILWSQLRTLSRSWGNVYSLSVNWGKGTFPSAQRPPFSQCQESVQCVVTGHTQICHTKSSKQHHLRLGFMMAPLAWYGVQQWTAIACPHRSSWGSGGNVAICR